MVNEWEDPEIYKVVEDLRTKLENATVDIRQIQGLDAPLSVAELFATRRAASLPAKVRKMWDTLLALDEDEQQIMTPGGHPCSQPWSVIAPLSDKLHDLILKDYKSDSPEYKAASTALFYAMYEGMKYSDWVQVRIQRRREAANIGY